MNSIENRKLIEGIFSGQLKLVDQLAEDAIWVAHGLNTYNGNAEILTKLLLPMMQLMASMGSMVVSNMVAEGDSVVVEAAAKDRVTKSGEQYNNTYCLIYKIENGKIKRISEYCDTALLKTVFGKYM